MLQTLRKGAAGWVAKVFMGVLVLSFAVWGVADIFRVGGSGQNAAVVGDRNITVEEFRQAYQGETRRISQQARRVITPEQARMAGVGDRVIGNLVNDAALDARVKTLGISISDEEVAREVQEDDIFQGPTGSFDRRNFQEILRQNNLTENDYIRLQRSFTSRRQLTDALAGDIAAPDALRQAIHAYNADSRSIAYAELKPEDPAAVPAPQDAALRKFFDERKATFNAPEYRSVALISLDPKTLAAGMNIPDTELRAYYDANRPKYAGEEKRSIEQISFPTLDEAKAASEAIKQGGLFEQAIVQRKMKPEDAFLGNLTKAQMFDAKVADAAFALKQGEVSEPVEGTYSTVLLRVTGIQEQKVKPFEQVREEIRAAIGQERGKQSVTAIHDKIDEARLGGATLEEIAKAQNLQLRSVEAVDETGKGPDGKTIDLPQSQKLVTSVFATEQGAQAEPVSADDAYVYFDVRGIKPARERDFDEAKTAVERSWREEEARKRLDARTEAALAELKGGKTIEQVAQSLKVESQQAETTRGGGAPSITPAQASAVFRTPLEGFGSTAADEAGARLVFQVTSENIRPFEPSAPDDSGQLDKIAESISADMVSAFVKKLRQDLGARLDPAAIAQVVGGAS